MDYARAKRVEIERAKPSLIVRLGFFKYICIETIYIDTMVDKIILGLLSKKALTVYDIKMAMDKSISQFYSSSFGSINPTVKKLEQHKFISCTEQVGNGRLKKTYSITPLGKAEYDAWLSSPIRQGRIKDEFLVRVFFLGDSNPKERKRLLKEYMGIVEESRESLSVLSKDIEGRDLSSISQDSLKYQQVTLQFGMDYFDFKLKWIEKMMKEL